MLMSGAPEKKSSSSTSSSSSFPLSWLEMGLIQFPSIVGQSSNTTAFHVSAERVSAPLTFRDLASAKVRLVLEKWGVLKGTHPCPLALLAP